MRKSLGDGVRVQRVSLMDDDEAEQPSVFTDSRESVNSAEITELGGTSVKRSPEPAVSVFQALPHGLGTAYRFTRRFDPWHVLHSGHRVPASGVAVRTAYKTKDRKVRPVDSDRTDGSHPAGTLYWLEPILQKEVSRPLLPEMPYDEWLTPKFSTIPVGSRLTPERISKLEVGSFLSEEEKKLLHRVLFNREAALSWDFSEIGLVKDEVMPPVEIKTVPHTAWQTPSFAVPKALNETVSAMLRERMEAGLLEECHGPYRNPYFLVKKKEANKYRIVNAAMDINRVTIRDANLPPNADEFAEEFAGLLCASIVDFFSGYDQMTLAKASRDLTGFQTPIGLLRMTRLPQGATNSVAQFVRLVTRILFRHLRKGVKPFVDDVGIPGPRSDYGGEEAAPGIRRFILEHIQLIDQVLADIERSGCTISGAKSQFCMQGVKLVGYVCDRHGRHPDVSKVIKILEWKVPTSKSEVRTFIGICVYYRQWVKGFATIAAPLYNLLRNEAIFVWGVAQAEAMAALQTALTSPPALLPIRYDGTAGRIVLGVDSSLDGWGAHLSQEELDNPKHRHPARYESGIWNQRERAYDAGKRECRGVLKALKKVKSYVYGVPFILEIDPKTLVAQLNKSAADLPGSVMSRWVAWIRLFDFEVHHVPGSKHTAADSLSRRPHTEADIRERAEEQDIDEVIDADLFAISVIDEGANSGVGEGSDVRMRTEEIGSPNTLEDGYSDGLVWFGFI